MTFSDLEGRDAKGHTFWDPLNYAPTVWPARAPPNFYQIRQGNTGGWGACFHGVRHAPILRGGAQRLQIFTFHQILTKFDRASKFAMITPVWHRCVSRGQTRPILREWGLVPQNFLGPYRRPHGLRTWGSAMQTILNDRGTCTISVPKISTAFYTGAHGTRNSNQILHDAQTILEENFTPHLP